MSTKAETRDLLKVIRDLHQTHDHGVLLERILHEARIFVHADAGTLYLCNGDNLYFRYIENDKLFPEGKSEDKFNYIDKYIPIDKTSLAGFVAITRQPCLIDDVYQLPTDVDFSFNPEFDQENNYRTKSQLVIPLIGREQKALGVIQLINAQYGGKTVPFSAMDRVHISFLADHAVLALEKAEMAREMVMRMVQISELQDPDETGNHARRVGEYASILYDRFAVSEGISLVERNQNKEALRAAAILHDVGKAGIPNEILTKKELYTPEEKHQMHYHTIYGARLFPNMESLWDRMANDVILNHHERWDGSGYPGEIQDISEIPEEFGEGKHGENIPISARIVAIADVYDALTSVRSYKEAWDTKAALHYVKIKSGKLFDPKLVDIFLEMEDILDTIKRQLP